MEYFCDRLHTTEVLAFKYHALIMRTQNCFTDFLKKSTIWLLREGQEWESKMNDFLTFRSLESSEISNSQFHVNIHSYYGDGLGAHRWIFSATSSPGSALLYGWPTSDRRRRREEEELGCKNDGWILHAVWFDWIVDWKCVAGSGAWFGPICEAEKARWEFWWDNFIEMFFVCGVVGLWDFGEVKSDVREMR